MAPKPRDLSTNEHSISDMKWDKKPVATKIHMSKKHKVMNKLWSQINKNLDVNITNDLIKESTSPNKRNNISSSRKKPPLVKMGGSNQPGKMLRYPSNMSNHRNTSYSVKSNSGTHQIILPSGNQKKSNSLKRADNDSNQTYSDRGE